MHFCVCVHEKVHTKVAYVCMRLCVHVWVWACDVWKCACRVGESAGQRVCMCAWACGVCMYVEVCMHAWAGECACLYLCACMWVGRKLPVWMCTACAHHMCTIYMCMHMSVCLCVCWEHYGMMLLHPATMLRGTSRWLDISFAFNT
jgi:hypothetical protein